MKLRYVALTLACSVFCSFGGRKTEEDSIGRVLLTSRQMSVVPTLDATGDWDGTYPMDLFVPGFVPSAAQCSKSTQSYLDSSGTPRMVSWAALSRPTMLTGCSPTDVSIGLGGGQAPDIVRVLQAFRLPEAAPATERQVLDDQDLIAALFGCGGRTVVPAPIEVPVSSEVGSMIVEERRKILLNHSRQQLEVLLSYYLERCLESGAMAGGMELVPELVRRDKTRFTLRLEPSLLYTHASSESHSPLWDGVEIGSEKARLEVLAYGFVVVDNKSKCIEEWSLSGRVKIDWELDVTTRPLGFHNPRALSGGYSGVLAAEGRWVDL